ncbi:MAG: hypothetical protein ACP5JP_10705 [bacterium]
MAWEPGYGKANIGEQISNDTHRSNTDSDARLARKACMGATELSHAVTYVMDSELSYLRGCNKCSEGIKQDNGIPYIPKDKEAD